ncbi:MAG: hypothetical protein RL242_2344 [Pseudomonadota bacterium]|jgi:hypothetical protein
MTMNLLIKNYDLSNMENHENLDISHKISITDVVSQVFSILYLEPTIGMLIGLGDSFLS